MCKHNEYLSGVNVSEGDTRRRAKHRNGCRQTIPALPDFTTGSFPDPTSKGKTRLTPPVVR